MTRVESLLLDFNKNPENRELQDFYSKKSMMEMLGVARSEVAHSAFLAWLFGGDDVCVHQADSPLMWLLQVLVMREYTRKSNGSIPGEIKTKILNRILRFEIIEVKTEKKVKDVSGDYFDINYEGQNPSDDKLDIYIKGRLDNGEYFEIFIENKITSPEEGPKTGASMKLEGYDDQSQTNRYYMATSGNGSNLKLYVYLRPDALDDSSKSSCENDEYIQICYQDLLDYILIPLIQNEDLSERSRILIQEYIDSLSIPTLDTSANKRIIMATSHDEADRINSFMKRNKELMYLVLKALLARKKSAALTPDEQLLIDFAESNKNLIYAANHIMGNKSLNLDELYDSSKAMKGYLIEPDFRIYNDANFGFEFACGFAWWCVTDLNIAAKSLNDIKSVQAKYYKEAGLGTTKLLMSAPPMDHFAEIPGFPFKLYALKWNWKKDALDRIVNAKHPFNFKSEVI